MSCFRIPMFCSPTFNQPAISLCSSSFLETAFIFRRTASSSFQKQMNPLDSSLPISGHLPSNPFSQLQPSDHLNQQFWQSHSAYGTCYHVYKLFIFTQTNMSIFPLQCRGFQTYTGCLRRPSLPSRLLLQITIQGLCFIMYEVCTH